MVIHKMPPDGSETRLVLTRVSHEQSPTRILIDLMVPYYTRRKGTKAHGRIHSLPHDKSLARQILLVKTVIHLYL